MDRRTFFQSFGAFAAAALAAHKEGLAQGGQGNVGVVYTGQYVFMIVVGKTDLELAGRSLQPGQMMFTFDPNKFASPEHALADHLGIKVDQLPDPYCAVIDKDTQLVTEVILADPALDYPLGKLVAAPRRVRPGWKHDGTKFLARGVATTVNAGRATVTAVTWADPDALPAGFVESDTLQVNDPISGFVGVAPAQGVDPL